MKLSGVTSIKNTALYALSLSFLLAAMSTLPEAATAAPTAITMYSNAMSLYQSGNYAKALTAFEAIARANPTDGTAHYYIGLCCQSLNQISRATTEYKYVASAGRTAQLRQLAQSGLASLSKYQRTSSDVAGLPLSSPAARQKAAQASAWAAMHSGPAMPAFNLPKRVTRVKKVIEFYTNWCSVCSGFAETFERTKNLYRGKVEFEQLDAEDPNNSEQKLRYSVNRYPTLIYLDASGTVLRRAEGAPMGQNFANTIESL